MIHPTPTLRQQQHHRSPTSPTNTSNSTTSISHPSTPENQPVHTNDNPDSYGHNHHHKSPSSFRIYFQNINGIKWDNHLTDATQNIQTLQELQVDAFGLAETNLDFQQPSVLHRLHQTTRYLYQRQLHLTPSSSQVKFPTPYKPGGTITVITGWWTSRIISKGEDPSGTGCWSFTKLRARKNRILVIVTVYRLSPQTSSSQLGPYTVFSQLQQTLNQRSSIDPRKQFDTLLQQQLQSWIDDNHEIILMIDANEPTYNPPRHFSSLIHNLHLKDIFQHVHQSPEDGTIPKFPTHERGSRRIDYMFASPTLLTYIKKCGYLSFSDSLDSDHRGLFTDFDIQGLFGPRDSIPPPTSRVITSQHAQRIRKFLNNLTTKLENKNITDRLTSLQQANTQGVLSHYHQRRYNAIDSDITNAILHAETASYRNPQTHPWSPKLRDAGLTVRYWKLRLRHLQTGKNLTPRIQHLQQKLLITDTAGTSIFSVTTQLHLSRHALKAIRKTAIDHRSAFLHELAEFKAEQQHDQTHASIIRRIQHSELQKTAYSRCSAILNPSKRSGLTRLQVPTSSITSPTNLQPNDAAILHYPETSTAWTEVTTKDDIEAHLIARNRTHYRQANNTPFGNTPHGQAFEFLGTNNISQSILHGTYPVHTANLHPTSQAYIRNLKFHPQVAAGNLVNTEITTSTLRHTFQCWREHTSTSPSGRHLGLYKSIFLNHPINESNPAADAITAILQLALTSNLLPDRWLRMVSVCLEKKPGQPQTDKIRIIHLFEADFNGLLKYLWGRKLVQHAEKIKAYPDSQHGSRPGRSAITASLIKTLAFNNSILLRNTMCLVDNDATACYDRIPNSLGSISCQRVGMPPHAERLHNNTLLHAQYHIKTAYGISDSTYQGSPDNPLQGQGQGSGNAPATWNSIMSPMWITLNELISDNFISEKPTGANYLTTQGNSFVDDTSLFFNIRLTRPTPP